jgi:hypothetical protein
MKWPLIRTTLNSMMISAIPCLHACLREALWRSKAEMPHYGMQACDLKKININT